MKQCPPHKVTAGCRCSVCWVRPLGQVGFPKSLLEGRIFLWKLISHLRGNTPSLCECPRPTTFHPAPPINTLLLKVGSMDQQTSQSSGSLEEIQSQHLPTPSDLLNSTLHFNKSPGALHAHRSLRSTALLSFAWTIGDPGLLSSLHYLAFYKEQLPLVVPLWGVYLGYHYRLRSPFCSVL